MRFAAIWQSKISKIRRVNERSKTHIRGAISEVSLAAVGR
jgi:hypothetical protein